jgi:hypothetical protein
VSSSLINNDEYNNDLDECSIIGAAHTCLHGGMLGHQTHHARNLQGAEKAYQYPRNNHQLPDVHSLSPKYGHRLAASKENRQHHEAIDLLQAV